jgi:hypothetical protein
MVTSKEILLQLVERLSDEQADELLRLATHLYADPDRRHPLPAFVGIGDSGRTDVSERVDELLRVVPRRSPFPVQKCSRTSHLHR